MFLSKYRSTFPSGRRGTHCTCLDLNSKVPSLAMAPCFFLCWTSLTAHPPQYCSNDQDKMRQPGPLPVSLHSFFDLFELAIQGERTDYKALQWKSIPELSQSPSALPYLLLRVSRPKRSHIKIQNPKRGQRQRPLQRLW